MRETTQSDIAKIETELVDIEERMAELKNKIGKIGRVKVSKDEFLNLLKNLPQQIRSDSVVEKDAIARFMVLNLEIDNEKRPHFLWKEPFATLLEGKDFTIGARDWT